MVEWTSEEIISGCKQGYRLIENFIDKLEKNDKEILKSETSRNDVLKKMKPYEVAGKRLSVQDTLMLKEYKLALKHNKAWQNRLVAEREKLKHEVENIIKVHLSVLREYKLEGQKLTPLMIKYKELFTNLAKKFGIKI